MEFLCCEKLLKEFIFHENIIAFCCAKVTEELLCEKNYDGSVITKERYLEARNKYIDKLKQGIIPDTCKICHNLEKKEWDETVGFSLLSIAHRTKCSICNCFYCTLSNNDPRRKRRYNSIQSYDIRPVLENLKNENMILPGCTIAISGGECCEYPKGELEYMTHFAQVNNCVISYLTSGIKYSKCIASALETIPSSVLISVDSGTKEMFEKIKQVKAYNIVWDNLKKYIERSKNNPLSNVYIKYIILPGTNDNVEEAKAFMKKCEEIDTKRIIIDMEISFLAQNQNNRAEGSLKDVICYFHELSKTNKKIDICFSDDCKFWCLKQVD